jgi:hypothetical protein
MTIRAERDGRFYLRFLIIGLAAMGFACWALYDGFIKYPLAQERALVFEKLIEEGRGDDWDEEAIQRGWSTTPPAASKPEEEYEVDVKMQFWMAGGAALVGLFPLLAVFMSRGRWIELDNNTLTSSWGQTVTTGQVTALEKRQWRNKGIAKLRYDDNGRKKTFVIDDFKFKRTPTDQILAEIEKQISHEIITGGPPEGFEVAEAEAMAEAETAANN